MVPVVLGASMENVQKLLPPNSFIHVENFTGPADLTNYLKYLDENPQAYRFEKYKILNLFIHNVNV